MNDKKKQILVVEDVLIAQKIVAILFEQHSCQVIAANNGAKARSMVHDQEFDMILMDLGLPDTDGMTLTRELRQMGGWLADVPIVAMTAHTDMSFKGEALQAGITDFYVKPITIAITRAIYENHLQDSVPQTVS